jgi:hypothetical protein
MVLNAASFKMAWKIYASEYGIYFSDNCFLMQACRYSLQLIPPPFPLRLRANHYDMIVSGRLHLTASLTSSSAPPDSTSTQPDE